MGGIGEVDVALEEDAAKRYKIKLRFFSPLFFLLPGLQSWRTSTLVAQDKFNT